MIQKHIYKLPHHLQMHIQSYLYFSKDVADQMKIVNHIIKNYDILLWREFKRIFHKNMTTLYSKFITYIFITDSIFHKVVEIKFYNNICEYMFRVLKQLNIIEKQKLYNSIMFNDQ